MGIYKIHLAGESFGNRQNNILTCWEGQEVILKREPKNRYDSSAIRVLVGDKIDLGYIGRDNAEWLAEIIDGGRPVSAKIKAIIGGHGRKKNVGIILDVYTGKSAADIVFSKGPVKPKPSNKSSARPIPAVSWFILAGFFLILYLLIF